MDLSLVVPSLEPDKIPEGSVVLGYIHRPQVPHEFLECLLNLQSSRIGINRIIHQRTFFVATGRNKVVKEFLETTKAEWLLFVDDDIAFTPKDILKLYSFADKDKAPIVGGLYFGRLDGSVDNQILPVWLMKEEGKCFSSLSRLQGTGLQKVDVLGMGFTLIHRGVLEKMADFEAGNPGADDWVWFGHDIRNGHRIGEDATFCLRAAARGYPVYGCSQVIVNHLKDHVYTAKMFLDQPGLFRPLEPLT